jgi:hypothetical protein
LRPDLGDACPASPLEIDGVLASGLMSDTNWLMRLFTGN